MADVHDVATRSKNMRSIRSKDTKPEMLVRRYLHGKGLRYALHNKKLQGRPDIVFKKYNTILFVNGCFWHGHKNCQNFVIPKTRTEWWLKKIAKTCERDKFAIKTLETDGWRVIILWECELHRDYRYSTLVKLYEQIISGSTRP